LTQYRSKLARRSCPVVQGWPFRTDPRERALFRRRHGLKMPFGRSMRARFGTGGRPRMMRAVEFEASDE